MVSLKKYIVGLLLLALLSLIVYRIFFRNIVEVSLIRIEVDSLSLETEGDIKAFKLNSARDFDLSIKETNEIIRHHGKYAEIRYVFQIKNKSNSKKIWFLKIRPRSANATKEILVGRMAKDNTIVDDTNVNPGEDDELKIPAIVKKADLSDGEIIKKAIRDKFWATCWTGNNLFDIGFNFRMVKFEKRMEDISLDRL